MKIDYPRAGRTDWRRFVPSRRQSAAVVGGFFGFLVLLFVVAYARADLDKLNELAVGQTTVIRYSDGSEIGRLGAQNRIDVPLSKVPEHVQHAVLAAENRKYYSEPGISPRGIVRAFWTNVTGGDVQGGSTITQQYAKNAYLTQDRTLSRKLKELVFAIKLDHSRSKNEVLESYLNTIYFGRGAYGIQVASQTYFGKDVSKLSVSEGALLAAVIRSPAGYDPANHPERAKDRWGYVLSGMVSEGWLTETDKGKQVFPKDVKAPAVNRLGGAKGYILRAVQDELAAKDVSEDRINLGGLEIVTTITKKAQQAAEDALKEAFPESPDDVHVSLTAIEPGTGKVRAMLGGRDYAKRQFNDATQAKRQPGSAFKPFVLVAALQDGIALDSRYDGRSPKDFPGREPVRNFGPGKGEQFGQIDLVTATAHSVNTVYYQLGLDAGGPKRVIETAQAAGVTSEIDPKKAGTNVFLGSGDTVVTNSWQMADAYATFAAQGEHATPYLVAEVKDRKGHDIYKAKDDTDRAFDEDVIADATVAMQEVIKDGTARGAAIGRPAAGKTGTVEKNTDAWFCGYVPQLAASVHVYRDGTKPLRGLAGYGEVTGGTLPAKIWRLFMSEALQGVPVKNFPPRADVGKAKNPAPATATATPSGSATPTPLATLPSSAPTVIPTVPPVDPSPTSEPEPTPTGGGGGGGGDPTPQPSSSP